MIANGIVNSYNGEYGTIKVDSEIIDFENKDISFNKEINVGDLVKFRIEKRFPDIKIARNILVCEKDDLFD